MIEQELGAAVQESAANDLDKAHIKTLTFDCTDDEAIVNAVLSGTDGCHAQTPS